MTLSLPPEAAVLPPNSRPRTLYLPHTQLTLQSLLHFLYTSSLPSSSSTLCTPQILCSLLQIARPYKIDGLLEAVVERLHGVLDSRNAAAVFNASAMAAGGGRSTSASSDNPEAWLSPTFSDVPGTGTASAQEADRNQALRINTSVGQFSAHNPDEDGMNAVDSATSDVSGSDISGTRSDGNRDSGEGRQIWKGDVSAVIGLQKRGLRGLMEGRRLRERGASVGPQQGGPVQAQTQPQGQSQAVRVGLGIAGGPTSA